MLETHPWAGLTDLPSKVADGVFYTGTNCLLLWAVQDTLQFRSARWGSFKALKEGGFTVQRGSRHTLAIYGSSGTRSASAVNVTPAGDAEQQDREAGEASREGEATPSAATTRRIPMLKPIQLFNLAQCSEFVAEHSDALAGEAVQRYLADWQRCSDAVEGCFKAWAKQQKEIELTNSEIPLMLRLAADFASVRAMGHADVIAEPLPAFDPNLAPQRLLKICGIAQEISLAAQLKTFGSVPPVSVTREEKAATAPVSTHEAPAEEAISAEVPADKAPRPAKQRGKSTLKRSDDSAFAPVAAAAVAQQSDPAPIEAAPAVKRVEPGALPDLFDTSWADAL